MSRTRSRNKHVDESLSLRIHYAPGVVAGLTERVATAVKRAPVDASLKPGDDRALDDEKLPLLVRGEGVEVGVSEPLTDLGGAACGRRGTREVAFRLELECERDRR